MSFLDHFFIAQYGVAVMWRTRRTHACDLTLSYSMECSSGGKMHRVVNIVAAPPTAAKYTRPTVDPGRSCALVPTTVILPLFSCRVASYVADTHTHLSCKSKTTKQNSYWTKPRAFRQHTPTASPAGVLTWPTSSREASSQTLVGAAVPMGASVVPI